MKCCMYITWRQVYWHSNSSFIQTSSVSQCGPAVKPTVNPFNTRIVLQVEQHTCSSSKIMDTVVVGDSVFSIHGNRLVRIQLWACVHRHWLVQSCEKGLNWSSAVSSLFLPYDDAIYLSSRVQSGAKGLKYQWENHRFVLLTVWMHKIVMSRSRKVKAR